MYARYIRFKLQYCSKIKIKVTLESLMSLVFVGLLKIQSRVHVLFFGRITKLHAKIENT